jgi:Icc protein
MTTILQISDPHLLSQAEGTLKGVPTAESLRLVLQRARKEIADPVRVILSGDLSHEETVAGYELLKELLRDWTGRSLLIPGNHDDRRGMRTVFDQVPGDADDAIWFREELGDWLLIGLDSHVPGEVHGELSDEILDKLDAWLSENPMRPTLIFLHHHPVSVNSEWLDAISLQNPAPLEKLVRGSQGVRGVFCGHIHQVYEGVFAGVPLYSAPSASVQFVPECETMQIDLRPPGFRVIELQELQISTRVVRLDEMPFVPRDD